MRMAGFEPSFSFLRRNRVFAPPDDSAMVCELWPVARVRVERERLAVALGHSVGPRGLVLGEVESAFGRKVYETVIVRLVASVPLRQFRADRFELCLQHCDFRKRGHLRKVMQRVFLSHLGLLRSRLQRHPILDAVDFASVHFTLSPKVITKYCLPGSAPHSRRPCPIRIFGLLKTSRRSLSPDFG